MQLNSSESIGLLKLPTISSDRVRSPSNVSTVTYNGSYPLLDEPINVAFRRTIFNRRTSHSLDLDAAKLQQVQRNSTVNNSNNSSNKMAQFADNLISNIHSVSDNIDVNVRTSDKSVNVCSTSSHSDTRNKPVLKRKSRNIPKRIFSLRGRYSVKHKISGVGGNGNLKMVPPFGSLRKITSSMQFKEGFFKSTNSNPSQNSNSLQNKKGSSPNKDQSDEVGSISADSYNEYIGGEYAGFRHPRPSTTTFLKEQLFAFFQPADNKLAMKLFGNKNALIKEKKRQQQMGRWIIHPCSSFRFYWDLLMLIILIANLIILPVTISFFNDDLDVKRIVFNCISDTIFLLDIIVNFRTGVITNDYADQIILKPKMIAEHYMKTWFFLDLLSSIPIDYIFLIFNDRDKLNQLRQAGRALRILRLAKLLSLLRLLRLSRLVRYVSQWEEFFNTASKFIGIFNLVLLMLLLGHWNACLQFLIPVLADYPFDSWIIKCDLRNANWFEQYTWALFKAMSHMLSIGYGRFPPTSISEAWVTIISMMTGATCYALFVGHAAALIQSFDTSKRLYREKFKQVEEYLAYRKLPRNLRAKVSEYYEHRYQGKMFDENAILNELSECLREQIINYNCRALVATVPFFTYADQNFVSEVVVQLKFEVFQPGDLIIKEGTLGYKMYFIQEGIVDIITKDGEVATSLSDGSYFGEICLLANARRVASVKAETYCNVYSLDRESFLNVLDHYPLMRRTMEGVAAERLNKIGQNPFMVSDRNDLKEDLRLVNQIVKEVSSEGHSLNNSDDEKGSNEGGRRKSSRQQALRKFLRIRSKARDLGLHWKRKASENRSQSSVMNENGGETSNLMDIERKTDICSQSSTSHGPIIIID